MIIGAENVERPSVLTEKMTKVLKFKVSYLNGQELMDYSAQNRCECIRVCVCARAEACRVWRCSCRHSLAILKSFSVLKHFDDNTIKW